MPAQLQFIAPMECKEVRAPDQLPRGKGWQYEVKLDGYRCIAIKQHNEVQLFSRRGKPFAQFPNLFASLLEQRARDFIVDGEIVALDAYGRSNFNALQRWGRSPVDVHFFAFDLLHLNGESLARTPLHERQNQLWQSFLEGGFIHLPRPLKADLDLILTKVKAFGFEGIVAKQIDSTYEPGQRSGAWIKMKMKQSDEFIVGGYISGGNRVDELIVGKPSPAGLQYVESLDDGFIPATRLDVFAKLKKFATLECPFVNLPEKNGPHRMDREKMRKATWVKPRLVAEIAFNEWTPDGHLRHGEFKSLRADIGPKDVRPRSGTE